LIIDDLLTAVVTDKLLEPVHQIGISANEIADFVYEDIFADKILREQVAELQELVHGLLITDVFLHAIKESKLFRRRSRRRGRRQWFRHNGRQSWRHSWSIWSIRLVMKLGSLLNTRISTFDRSFDVTEYVMYFREHIPCSPRHLAPFLAQSFPPSRWLEKLNSWPCCCEGAFYSPC